MSYNVGDIFTLEDEYTERANFCNENGCYIAEIEPLEDGTRRFQIKEVAKPTLDELKIRKLSSMKFQFETSRNNLTCGYSEDKFDCNMNAQANMTTLLTFGNMSPNSTFDVRSASEKTHTLNFTQLSELSQVMLNRVNELYAYYWSVKDSVHKAETEEELNQIDWNF